MRYYGSDKALLYDDYIALRDGKMTEERAKELGMTNFIKGYQHHNILGCLHNFKCGGALPEECTWGDNETSDNR